MTEIAVNKTSSNGGMFVYITAAISALGGALFGYDTGVISGAILFIQKDFMLSTIQEEVVLSAVLIGAVIGAVIGGKLVDYFGRRKVIIVTAVVFSLGAIFGASLAQNVPWLIIGRIIIGIAIGIASFAAPLYISEIAPVNIRGKLVGFNQLAVTVGIVIAYLVGYSLSGFSWGWRGMFAGQVIPAVILFFGMLKMPNSPRWLVSKNLIVQAREVLKLIRGPNDDIEGEIKEIQESFKKQSGDWKELFNPLVRPALIVGIGLAFFQQITGINTVIYYAPTIFKFAGFQSASSAILATVGVGVVNVLFTILGIHLVDRIGRRPLLLTGLFGMVVSLIILGAAFQVSSQDSHLIGWISIASLSSYVAFFAIGMGPVFWLLISEIYPLSVRGRAMSVATFVNWGSNLLVGISFLSIIKLIGRPQTFWVYGAMSVITWFFVYFYIPETKGKSLEEIEAHWRDGKHPLKMGK